MSAKKSRIPRAQRAERKFSPDDQMSCRVATFAKDSGEVMSCRVATFARSLETYDINICLDPDDIYVQPKCAAAPSAVFASSWQPKGRPGSRQSHAMVKRLIKPTKTEGERRSERGLFPKGVRFRTAILESPCHLWGTNPGRWNQGRKCKALRARSIHRASARELPLQAGLRLMAYSSPSHDVYFRNRDEDEFNDSTMTPVTVAHADLQIKVGPRGT